MVLKGLCFDPLSLGREGNDKGTVVKSTERTFLHLMHLKSKLQLDSEVNAFLVESELQTEAPHPTALQRQGAPVPRSPRDPAGLILFSSVRVHRHEIN